MLKFILFNNVSIKVMFSKYMNQELRSRSCRLFQSVILVQDPFYIIIDLMYLFPMLYRFKELYTNTCNAFSLHSSWNLVSSNTDTYTHFDIILKKMFVVFRKNRYFEYFSFQKHDKWKKKTMILVFFLFIFHRNMAA